MNNESSWIVGLVCPESCVRLCKLRFSVSIRKLAGADVKYKYLSI